MLAIAGVQVAAALWWHSNKPWRPSSHCAAGHGCQNSFNQIDQSFLLCLPDVRTVSHMAGNSIVAMSDQGDNEFL